MIVSMSFNILFFFAAWILLLRLKFVSIVTIRGMYFVFILCGRLLL